jgi:hypothetical protein
MTFIQCEVELRRTDGRMLSTSTSLQMRPVVDQLINVPVDDRPWVKAKIASVKPLNIRNTVFEAGRTCAAARTNGTRQPGSDEANCLAHAGAGCIHHGDEADP